MRCSGPAKQTVSGSLPFANSNLAQAIEELGLHLFPVDNFVAGNHALIARQREIGP